MAKSTSFNEVTPSEAISCLRAAANAKRSIFLWGPPGIGKSDIVRQVADQFSERDTEGNVIKECEVFDVRLLLLDPTDLRGVPYRDPADNRMKWSEPSILPREFLPNPGWREGAAEDVERLVKNNNRVILFLDELTAAPPSVQAAAYQLVLDRKIGEYNLPEKTLVVAAGNRTSDKGVAFKMPTPLANRFIHVEMRVSDSEWLEWAIDNITHPDVVGFISQFGSNLHVFKPEAADMDRAFPTPRSWAFVSDILKEADTNRTSSSVVSTLIQGTIGTGMAHEFDSWRRENRDVPAPKDIIMGKKINWDKNNGISAQYYITAGLCYEMHQFWDDKKNGRLSVEKWEEYTSNLADFIVGTLGRELQIMAFRTMIKTYDIKFNAKNKAFEEFLKKNAKMIIRAQEF